jgi:MFS family permease
MNFQKTIIFLALLLDIIGISVMIPAFPELKLYYGISDFAVTMGLTVYSLFAFLAAPVLGQLSDKYGRKMPLLRCVVGTLFSYLILLVTQNYILFLISRVINGITGGNISILQAILADISPTPEQKAKNF